ncbi:hypothetical protein [Pseudosulfitobacter sp. SM2401]|jgi:hypothetical protein|uniref:hypothetical protein n=1 Tax=Pseudosulfitobacter sp. SM2401 TaxID=3350098 RepID=UPI0036F384A4
MRSDWILDVLTDLKTFARSNELMALAEQLEDTAIVAMAEIATLNERQAASAPATEYASGTHIGGTRTS